jgi:hypothetical protein
VAGIRQLKAPDVDEQPVERAIVDYLTDHNLWERAAWKLSHSRRGTTHWPEVKATIRAEYAALLERHCAPRVVALGLLPAYGNPPEANPEGLRIVSTKRGRGAIKALTAERVNDGIFGAKPYEYELIEIDGELKLSERRARFADRRPIRDVW